MHRLSLTRNSAASAYRGQFVSVCDPKWPRTALERVGGAGERRLELLGELDVEEAQRELVGLDQVHELLRLLDLRQVAVCLGPDGSVGRRDVGGHEVVRGDPLAELGAVDAGVVEVLDLLAQTCD